MFLLLIISNYYVFSNKFLNIFFFLEFFFLKKNVTDFQTVWCTCRLQADYIISNKYNKYSECFCCNRLDGNQ